MTADDQPAEPLDARARMVRSAARMIRERGVHAVGLRQIATDAGGSRGSLQRFFPGGKNQVIVEAVDYAIAHSPIGLHEAGDAPDLPAAIHLIVEAWRQGLLGNGFRAGCPIASVVVDEAGNDVLRERADTLLGEWRTIVAKIYRRFGYSRDDAWSEALLVITAIEGAVLLGRASRTTEAIDGVEQLLLDRAAMH